jgi:hypothetical protein
MPSPSEPVRPAALEPLPRWVPRREKTRKGKKTKAPLTIQNWPPLVTTPANWADYAAVSAVLAKNAGLFDDVGVVLGQFSADEFIAGILTALRVAGVMP